MKTWLGLGSFLIWLVLLSSSGLWADTDLAVLAKLRQIPPASAASIRYDSKAIPLLVVKAQGVFINNSKTPVPFDQVLKALAELPKEAWPYGRVITYYPGPFGEIEIKDQPFPADVKKVEADLKAAGIKLEYGTSE